MALLYNTGSSDSSCYAGGWWLQSGSSPCQYVHLTRSDGPAVWDWSYGAESPLETDIDKVLVRARPLHPATGKDWGIRIKLMYITPDSKFMGPT